MVSEATVGDWCAERRDKHTSSKWRILKSEALTLSGRKFVTVSTDRETERRNHWLRKWSQTIKKINFLIMLRISIKCLNKAQYKKDSLIYFTSEKQTNKNVWKGRGVKKTLEGDWTAKATPCVFLNKLSLKPLRSREKPLVLRFTVLLMRKCSLFSVLWSSSQARSRPLFSSSSLVYNCRLQRSLPAFITTKRPLTGDAGAGILHRLQNVSWRPL